MNSVVRLVDTKIVCKLDKSESARKVRLRTRSHRPHSTTPTSDTVPFEARIGDSDIESVASIFEHLRFYPKTLRLHSRKRFQHLPAAVRSTRVAPTRHECYRHLKCSRGPLQGHFKEKFSVFRLFRRFIHADSFKWFRRRAQRRRLLLMSTL